MEIKKIKQQAKNNIKTYKHHRMILLIPLVTVRLYLFSQLMIFINALQTNMMYGSNSIASNGVSYNTILLLIGLLLWAITTMVTKPLMFESISQNKKPLDVWSNMSVYATPIYAVIVNRWIRNLIYQIPTMFFWLTAYATAMNYHYDLTDKCMAISIITFILGYWLANRKRQLVEYEVYRFPMYVKEAAQASKLKMTGNYKSYYKLKASFIIWNICNWCTFGLLSLYLYQYKVASLLILDKEFNQ